MWTFLCFAYIDAFLVAGAVTAQPEKHYLELFRGLEEYGIVLSIEKCRFELAAIESNALHFFSQ